MISVAGVDGWRDGWIIAIWSPDTAVLVLRSEPDFGAVLRAAESCSVVGVDMPLSLPVAGLRETDALLRTHLGRRSSSLFMTPCRSAVAQPDWESANIENKSVTGKGLSKQSWGLTPKIREARAAMLTAGSTTHPHEGSAIYEVHPESSLVALCQHDRLANKKTAHGVGQRLEALERHFGPLGATLAACPPGPSIDDALDAIAAAWTSERVVAGTAKWFGPTGTDDEGYPTAVPV